MRSLLIDMYQKYDDQGYFKKGINELAYFINELVMMAELDEF